MSRTISIHNPQTYLWSINEFQLYHFISTLKEDNTITISYFYTCDDRWLHYRMKKAYIPNF